MRIRILLMLIALTGMLFSISALAATIEDCDEIPITPFSWTLPVSVDKFDQNKGELEEVRITVESCGNLSYAVSNEDLTPQEYEITHRGQTIAVIPSVGEQVFPIETYGILDLEADEPNEIPDPDWKGGDYGVVGGPEEICYDDQFILKASNGDDLTPYKGNENE